MKRLELLHILSQANLAVSTSLKSIPGADCYTFYKNKIFTFQGVVCTIQDWPYDWAFRLNAEKFYTALKYLEGDDLTITEGSQTLTLKGSGRKKYELPIQHPETLVFDLERFIPDAWGAWESGIDGAYTTIIECCVEAPMKYQLAGVCVSEGWAYSTDDHIIQQWEMPENFPTVWLDKPVIDLLKRRRFRFSEYYNDNRFIYFQNSNLIVGCQKLPESQYLLEDLKGYLAKCQETKSFPKEAIAWLMASFDASKPFLDAEGDIFLSLGQEMRLYSQDPMKGIYEDSLPYQTEISGVYKVPVRRVLAFSKATLSFMALEDHDGFEALVFKQGSNISLIGIDKVE